MPSLSPSMLAKSATVKRLALSAMLMAPVQYVQMQTQVKRAILMMIYRARDSLAQMPNQSRFRRTPLILLEDVSLSFFPILPILLYFSNHWLQKSHFIRPATVRARLSLCYHQAVLISTLLAWKPIHTEWIPRSPMMKWLINWQFGGQQWQCWVAGLDLFTGNSIYKDLRGQFQRFLIR